MSEAAPQGAPVHHLPVRVYYEDTDAGGIVYHANYLRFAERGRTECLRALGVSQQAMREDHGVVFVVRRCVMDFIAPARLDDALVIATELVEVAGASLVARQIVRRDGRDLVRMVVRVALIRFDDGRPARIPKALRALLAAQVSTAPPPSSAFSPPKGAVCRETDTI